MRSVRRGSLLRVGVLVALAACLSSGMANAQISNRQSRLTAATRGTAASSSIWNYSVLSSAGAVMKYAPPDPCRSTPPDPCSPWQRIKQLVAQVASLF